jgi:hypothetical protein
MDHKVLGPAGSAHRVHPEFDLANAPEVAHLHKDLEDLWSAAGHAVQDRPSDDLEAAAGQVVPAARFATAACPSPRVRAVADRILARSQLQKTPLLKGFDG